MNNPLRTKGLFTTCGRAAAAWLLSAWLCVGAAHGMGVSPVLVELSSARRVVSVVVSNPTTSPKTFQTQLLSWRQENGVDHYGESEDLIVTPAIAQIAAGGTQVFRVALRGVPPMPVERSYRLILEDISEENASQGGSVVNLRFRFSLPVMVAPSLPVSSAPRWSLCPAPAGKGCLRLDNEGNRRLRLSTLSLEGQGGWRQDVVGAAGTILAGAWKQWMFELSPQHQGLPQRISAKGESGTLQGEILPAR